MSGIVGIFSESESSENIFPIMVERLSHRGPLTKFRYELQHGIMHLGIFGDNPSFLENYDNFRLLAIDGQAGCEGFADQIVQCLNKMKCSIVMSECLQMLTAIGVIENKVQIFRSLDGVKPLYFAKIVNGIVFSSERKAIRAIDSQGAEALNPGFVLSILDKGQKELIQVQNLSRPQISPEFNKEDHLNVLENLLTASFSRMKQVGKCGVLFSGGVDSSLAALMTKKVNPDTLLISAATPESKDFEKTKTTAYELSLDHELVTLDVETVWETLPEIIYAIESCGRMDVEIAIPFFLAANAAKTAGCKVLVSGQGPDELFAGYVRYEKMFLEKGADVVSDNLWADYSVTHETNIARDVGAIEYHGIGSFFPFLDLAFSYTALSTPVDLLLDPSNTPSRKILFRELAKRAGLPSDIADIQKHATQYSSGSSKILAQAVVKYVPEAKGLSKRDTSVIVGKVLHTIADMIGLPTERNVKSIVEFDRGPSERLNQKLRQFISDR
ncbi:MAG: DUF7411 family protein [Candidatus Thorarchaeota archaeon]|jgi:asparagine synthetase B (glutamine-hydrolysing)